MRTTIQIKKRFGSFLSNGDEGNKFRFCEVEPIISKGGIVVLNFEGVENMTDSFANACFGDLFFHHDLDLKDKVQFLNCSQIVKDFILSSRAWASRRVSVS